MSTCFVVLDDTFAIDCQSAFGQSVYEKWLDYCSQIINLIHSDRD
jgi:hypothetical protein